MSCLMRLLPLLAAAPLCTSFAPASISTRRNHPVLEASRNGHNEMENVGKAAGAAFLALTISFSPFSNSETPSFVSSANAMSFDSSITIARSAKTDDDAAVQFLEKETREVEKEAKVDAKKARIEKSREAFFEYEAKMAEQQESRIEAAEKKAELELENDLEEVETLKEMEEKAEKDAFMALTKKERVEKQKEAKALLAKEREIERKEKRAARAEKIFLAEEQQEQKILEQKEKAARAEEKKYEAVEKEYESVAELAKEDEVELELVKELSKKK